MNDSTYLIRSIDFSNMDIHEAVALATKIRDLWCLNEAHKLPAEKNHQLRVEGYIQDFRALFDEVKIPDYCTFVVPKVFSPEEGHENTPEETLSLIELAGSYRYQVANLKKKIKEGKRLLQEAKLSGADEETIARFNDSVLKLESSFHTNNYLLSNLQQEVDKTIIDDDHEE